MACAAGASASASEQVSEEAFDVIDYVVNKGNGVKGLSDMGLKSVPHQFIQPPEERFDDVVAESDESIPVIDVSNWDWDAGSKIPESICDAAQKWGFFQIINHGVPLEVLDNVLEAGHRFFGLPVEERRKYFFSKDPNPNSNSNTVQLKTSFIPHKVKVLEWKDYLTHICTNNNGAEDDHNDEDDDDPKGSAFWPPVSKYI